MNEDTITIALTKQVGFSKIAHPGDTVTSVGQDKAGNYLYKVPFKRNVEFGDKRIDINIGTKNHFLII